MDSDYMFCPKPECRHHTLKSQGNDWYYHYGYHSTKAFGKVRRYKCKSCGKTFSDQTFELNYWLKIKTEFKALGKELNSLSSCCFAARNEDLSADSIRIRYDRIARNSLFLQAELTKDIKINEPLVADGLESYTRNKYFPTNLNVLMGDGTYFVYYFNQSHSKRKGRITKAQKLRMESEYIGKCLSRSYIKKMFTKLIDYLEGKCDKETLLLNTDENTAYAGVVNRWNIRAKRKKEGERSSADTYMPIIEHRVTPSTAPRTKENPLKAVNYFDRQIRKDIPSYRRRTISQAKNDRNKLSRVAFYVATHNFFKPFLISSNAKQTEKKHSDFVIGDNPQKQYWIEKFFTKRFFHSFTELPEYFENIWFKRTPTPFKNEADPVPKFASQ